MTTKTHSDIEAEVLIDLRLQRLEAALACIDRMYRCRLDNDIQAEVRRLEITLRTRPEDHP